MPVSTNDLTGRLHDAVSLLARWLEARQDDPGGEGSLDADLLGAAVEQIESAAAALGERDGSARFDSDRAEGTRPDGTSDRSRPFAGASEGLRGQSRTITIPELLNFVASSYKSGLLRIRSDSESYIIQVDHGCVLDARCDRLREGERVVEILLDTGVVARSDVERVQERGGRPPDSVAGVLLAEGVVSEADVRGAVERQVRLIFQRLCDALEAEFWFYEGVRMSTAPRVELSVTALLLDSARLADEKAHFGGATTAVGAKAKRPERAAALDVNAPLEERFLAVVRRLVDEGNIDLPLFDASTCELVSLLWDEDLDAETLARRLELDMGVSSHLLRVANSARNAPVVPITSLQLAVTRLGLSGVRDSVLAITVKNKVFDVPQWNDTVRAIWSRSAVRSGFARAIGKASEVGTTRGTMAALLLDIGKPAILNALPSIEAELGEELDRELALLLVDEVHAEVGATLVERWNLPPWLRHVVRFQSSPELAPSHQLDTWLAHLADQFASWSESPDPSRVEDLIHGRGCLELCIFADAGREILGQAPAIREQASVYD